MNKKPFCLVILWEDHPDSTDCHRSRVETASRGAVFPRCCHTVALEGGWRGLSGRFPSGEQYPSCHTTDPRWETSGHVTAHSTAFQGASSLQCWSPPLPPSPPPPPPQLSCFLLILKATSVKPAAPRPCTLMLQKQTNEMSCGTWAGDPWFAGGLASGTHTEASEHTGSDKVDVYFFFT